MKPIKKTLIRAMSLFLVATLFSTGNLFSATQSQREDVLRNAPIRDAESGTVCSLNRNDTLTPPTSEAKSGIVFLSPGHDGSVTNGVDPVSGLTTTTTTNADGERQIVWRVASEVKKQLTDLGYNVVMAKDSEESTVTHQDRAKKARDSKAAIAVSIHTMGAGTVWGGQGEIYPQRVGLYREKPDGTKYEFKNPDIATKSQAYSEIFKEERNKYEKGVVIVTDNTGFNNRAEEGKSGGNISNEQLLGDTVPWVYLEAGQDGIVEGDYTKSIVDSIKRSVPPASQQTSASSFDNGEAYADPSTQANPYAVIEYNFPGFGASLDDRKLTDEQMAGAINKYIEDFNTKTGKVSPFTGKGSLFIKGGTANQINPFLAVAHLEIENGFATAPSGWHTIAGSNNAFGRTAGEDQPQVKSESGRSVYAWSSWEDSLNGQDSWFTYLRRKLDDGTYPKELRAYIYQYAPPDDGNDTEGYIANVKKIINSLAGLAGDPNIASYSDISTTGGLSCSANTGDATGIVGIALAEVGRAEDPIGSNCGTDIDKYFVDMGYSCGDYWCANFVRWVYKQAGYSDVGGDQLAKGVGAWFRDNKFFFKWQEQYRPLPGDVYVKSRAGSAAELDDGSGHIGIVVSVDGYKIETVDGNSADKVNRVAHPDYRSIPGLIGFGRYVDKSSVQPDPGFNPLDSVPAEVNTGISES